MASRNIKSAKVQFVEQWQHPWIRRIVDRSLIVCFWVKVDESQHLEKFAKPCKILPSIMPKLTIGVKLKYCKIHLLAITYPSSIIFELHGSDGSDSLLDFAFSLSRIHQGGARDRHRNSVQFCPDRRLVRATPPCCCGRMLMKIDLRSVCINVWSRPPVFLFCDRTTGDWPPLRCKSDSHYTVD